MSINGNIYVLNYDLTPENVYKVGKTINGKQQLKNRYSTYTPIGKPNILYWCKTMDVSYTEMTILDKLSKYQMKGEWFNCHLDIIKNIIDDTVLPVDGDDSESLDTITLPIDDIENLDTTSNQTEDPIETNNIIDTENDDTQTTKLCETENQPNITNITQNITIKYEMTCERCDKYFKQSGSLYRHLERKTPCDPIKSDIDPKALLDKLRKRQRKTTKVNGLYRCNKCNKGYKTTAGKSRHMKTCQGDIDIDKMVMMNKIENLHRQVEKLKEKSDSGKVTNIINGNINNLNITINTCGSKKDKKSC